MYNIIVTDLEFSCKSSRIASDDDAIKACSLLNKEKSTDLMYVFLPCDMIIKFETN